MKKICVYGFGRMGLTHFSILNTIHKDLHFSFVETNKKINLLMRNNLNVNFYSSDLKLISAFDLTLITTPLLLIVK